MYTSCVKNLGTSTFLLKARLIENLKSKKPVTLHRCLCTYSLYFHRKTNLFTLVLRGLYLEIFTEIRGHFQGFCVITFNNKYHYFTHIFMLMSSNNF